MSSAQPMSGEWLNATMALAGRCFPTDVGFKWALPLSVETGLRCEIGHAARLDFARQWIATDETQTVVGTFGLYRPTDDAARDERMLLLNWFCVAPGFRGRGLGRHLWGEILVEATLLGARRLVFYSSTEPFHVSAEKLYVAAGCARRMGPVLPDGQHRLTFFDLPLQPAVRPADVETAWKIDLVLSRQFELDADPRLVALASSRREAIAA